MATHMAWRESPGPLIAAITLLVSPPLALKVLPVELDVADVLVWLTLVVLCGCVGGAIWVLEGGREPRRRSWGFGPIVIVFGPPAIELIVLGYRFSGLYELPLFLMQASLAFTVALTIRGLARYADQLARQQG